jgi:protein-L-isoaspartate(D-aspartate) O-methyltransferase
MSGTTPRHDLHGPYSQPSALPGAPALPPDRSSEDGGDLPAVRRRRWLVLLVAGWLVSTGTGGCALGEVANNDTAGSTHGAPEAAGWHAADDPAEPSGAATAGAGGTVVRARHSAGDRFAALREKMVTEQLGRRGIVQPEVLAAMRQVPRHRFVPPELEAEAYEDHPLPIGLDQTISQPYIVALMTQLLDLDADDRVLEVGTGSGYHAAVMSRLARQVYSIEIVEPLARQARARLRALGYSNVELRTGDGYRGWSDQAPFDAIILTAAPREVPEPLLEQLAVGGRMVLPVGGDVQTLQLITRTAQGFQSERITAVRFVPMTGEAQGE